MRVLVPLLCSLPLAMACDGALPNSPAATVAGLEDGADCGAQYDVCLAEGGDALACREALLACIDAVPEEPAPPVDPWQACKDEVGACVDAGRELDACLDIMRGCVACEGPSDPGPGPGPDPEACHRDLESCLEAGVDPQMCHERLAWCLGGIPTEPTDPRPPEPCLQVLDTCLQAGEDPAMCHERFEQCQGLGQPTPDPVEDPCVQLFEDCLWSGADEVVCRERFAQCAGMDPGAPGGPGEPGEPCPPAAQTACVEGLITCQAFAQSDAELFACRVAADACFAAMSGR